MAIDQPERTNVLGVGISAINLESAVEIISEAVATPAFQGYVTVTGVHGVVESQKDEELLQIHNRSFLSTPDGMPMVWLSRWYGRGQVDRVYGPDLMLEILDSGRQQGMKHYLYGGAEGVAQELKRKLQSRLPGLQIVGACTPPFRVLNELEESQFIEELQREKPHYVWVGLSTPKQERFMCDLLNKYPKLTDAWGHGLCMLGVGAAFDFHSGRVKQAPRWIQRSGLEWFYRMLNDPKRLAKRYVYANSYFLVYLFLQLFGLKKY
nr:WecB/TagA/CpsF family glycosyltransferase [Rubritalea marina]